MSLTTTSNQSQPKLNLWNSQQSYQFKYQLNNLRKIPYLLLPLSTITSELLILKEPTVNRNNKYLKPILMHPLFEQISKIQQNFWLTCTIPKISSKNISLIFLLLSLPELLNHLQLVRPYLKLWKELIKVRLTLWVGNNRMPFLLPTTERCRFTKQDTTAAI